MLSHQLVLNICSCFVVLAHFVFYVAFLWYTNFYMLKQMSNSQILVSTLIKCRYVLEGSVILC